MPTFAQAAPRAPQEPQGHEQDSTTTPSVPLAAKATRVHHEQDSILLKTQTCAEDHFPAALHTTKDQAYNITAAHCVPGAGAEEEAAEEEEEAEAGAEASEEEVEADEMQEVDACEEEVEVEGPGSEWSTSGDGYSCCCAFPHVLGLGPLNCPNHSRAVLPCS